MTLLASCSVEGKRDAANNKRHQELLFEITQELRDHAPVDAVVLPGGYFVQEDQRNCYLDRSFEERCRLMRKAPFAQCATEAARTLESRRKGALLIFGVDTIGRKDPEGDQLCVAWSAQGPVGIGRKVFPTEYEGKEDKEKGRYVVNAKDFGAKERVVCLGDTRILLCACYDGYGIFNQPDKSKFIHEVISLDGRRVRRGDMGFQQSIKGGLSQWRKLVEEEVDAAAIAIHYFEAGSKGGFSTTYWRRHGIATASAKLSAKSEGGWAMAGAHFEGRLPHPATDVLAAHRVPEEHLWLGNCRETQDAEVDGEFRVGNEEVLLRLFEFEGG